MWQTVVIQQKLLYLCKANQQKAVKHHQPTHPTAMTAPAISPATARLLATIKARCARYPYTFVPSGCNQERLYVELVRAGLMREGCPTK